MKTPCKMLNKKLVDKSDLAYVISSAPAVIFSPRWITIYSAGLFAFGIVIIWVNPGDGHIPGVVGWLGITCGDAQWSREYSWGHRWVNHWKKFLSVDLNNDY